MKHKSVHYTHEGVKRGEAAVMENHTAHMQHAQGGMTSQSGVPAMAGGMRGKAAPKGGMGSGKVVGGYPADEC